MQKTLNSKLLVLTTGVIAAVNVASADTVTYTYAGLTAGGVQMGIHVGSSTVTGQIGEFIMTTSTPGFTSPLLSYCTDVAANSQPTFNYTTTPLSLATGASPAWISGGGVNAATIWFHDKAGATTAAQTAGLQIAIWELLYNSLAGSYSVSTFENTGNGGFYITTTDANSVAAMTDAAADLNSFSSLTLVGDSQVEWLAPTEPNGGIGGSQGLFYAVPGAVPETSSTLGLLGLAVIALFAGRKLSESRS